MRGLTDILYIAGHNESHILISYPYTDTDTPQSLNYAAHSLRLMCIEHEQSSKSLKEWSSYR